MGKKDIAVRRWLSDKGRFSDVCNAVLFGGEQVVLAEELERADSESDIIITDKRGKSRGVKRYRDIVMRWKYGAEPVLLAKLNPVITLVFYYGEKEWDGSRNLHEMFRKSGDERVSKIIGTYIPDYHINLIDVSNPENLYVFHSDLQLISGMLQYRNV